MNLYPDLLLDHAKHPRNVGRAKDAVTATLSNASCGDSITVYVKNKKIKYKIAGCAVATASASILSEKLKGKSEERIKKLTAKDLEKMLGFKLTPARVKCALLPLEAIKKALCS